MKCFRLSVLPAVILAASNLSGSSAAVGYRYWHAASPPPFSLPARVAAFSPTAPSRRSFPLPFDVRYLPLFALGLAVVVGLPRTALIGRWSGSVARHAWWMTASCSRWSSRGPGTSTT